MASSLTTTNANARTSLVNGNSVNNANKPLKTGFQATEATSTPEPVKTPQNAPEQPIDNNDAKMFIYFKESGNRTTARNSVGCLGLGQACPGSKLLAVCPDLNDYGCQDNFFTGYMQNRYGSWANARSFWERNHWW